MTLTIYVYIGRGWWPRWQLIQGGRWPDTSEHQSECTPSHMSVTLSSFSNSFTRREQLTRQSVTASASAIVWSNGDSFYCWHLASYTEGLGSSVRIIVSLYAANSHQFAKKTWQNYRWAIFGEDMNKSLGLTFLAHSVEYRTACCSGENVTQHVAAPRLLGHLSRHQAHDYLFDELTTS